MLTPFRTVIGLTLVAGVALLAFFVASAPHAQAPTPGTAAAAPRGAVVATVDGEAITEAELDKSIGAELGRLEEQVFELRSKRLQELIAERLVAREAARRGVTVDALVQSEITDKIVPVTEDEVTRFFEANKARLPNAPNIRAQIKAYLEAQRAEERHTALVDGLRGSTKVAITLARPPIRRAEVNVAGAPVRGETDAPVTIVEFSDFHCPFCRTVQPTLLQLLERYPGKVRLVYKDLPLDGLHPNARRVSESARCANEQGKFWSFHDVIYSGAVGNEASLEAMKTAAGKAGLDVEAFVQCAESGRHQAAIQRDVVEASGLGLSGTPAFFVNGRLLTGAVPAEAFVKIIDEELAALGR